MAEAVLADRVIVMSPHPRTIKAELAMRCAPAPDPLSIGFLDYQKELLHRTISATRPTPGTRLGKGAGTGRNRHDDIADWGRPAGKPSRPPAQARWPSGRISARRRRARPIRQGYQTNMWGMPTYYLMRSGLLEKHGIKFEEFAVASGNLTMQQMVARQVDLGTYAGQSMIIGNAKGGLVAVAVIEYVGRTTQLMARKDGNLTQGGTGSRDWSPTRPDRRSATSSPTRSPRMQGLRRATTRKSAWT